MKWLSFILITFSANAQFNFTDLAFMSQGSVSDIPCTTVPFTISSGTLVLDISACSSSSMTNTSDGSAVTNWFDLTANGNHLNASNLLSNCFPPLYKATGSPNGKPCVLFEGASAGGIHYMQCVRDMGLSQPTTWFFAMLISNAIPGSIVNTRDAIMDARTGNRELAAVQLPTASSGIFFAGSSLTPPVWPNDNTWRVHTIVFDGANSIWRTNGVDFFGGNVGANGMGKFILGSDATVATTLLGRISCILAYTGHLTTNDMQTVESNLRTQFGF